MEIIQVKDIINVDTISKSTTAWKNILETVAKVEGEVKLDFRGIQLIEPWTNADFKQLMSDPRVYVKVYTAEELKSTIELMLALGNLKTGRVENEDIISAYVISPREKKIRDTKASIMREIEDKDGVMTLDISHIVGYITESITLEALESAVDEINQDKNYTHFKVIISGVTITDPMLIRVAEIINEFDEKGIVIEIESSDDEVIGKITTFQCIGSKKISIQERYDIFKATVKTKTIGMLTKYAKTGRMDALGRMGDGIPIMCRPARFDGFARKDKSLYVVFTTFPLQTFYTKQDFYLDNDGLRLKKPQTIVMNIPIGDIGVCDRYTGREFHFNMPIQLEATESLTTSKVKDTKVETSVVTLPEFIKMVLDDHNIDYDSGALLDAIIETKKLLRNKGDFK